jgi:CubicO group peptidase (beta-lactamase class C family)
MAMAEQRVAPGPDPIPFGPDEYMRRIGGLPLAAQSGDRWMYHTGIDLTAVLIGRIVGQPLDTFLQERVFGPLAMVDTGFHVPEGMRLDSVAWAAIINLTGYGGRVDLNQIVRSCIAVPAARRSTIAS